MAQQACQRNGSAVTKCVFDDLRLALTIHQGHVKTHIRQAAIGFASKKFFCRRSNPQHLTC